MGQQRFAASVAKSDRRGAGVKGSATPQPGGTTVIEPTAVRKITLPLRPGTATQVLEMINDPSTSASDIGSVVRTEPVIVARLLALANSLVFRRRNEIGSIVAR